MVTSSQGKLLPQKEYATGNALKSDVIFPKVKQCVSLVVQLQGKSSDELERASNWAATYENVLKFSYAENCDFRYVCFQNKSCIALFIGLPFHLEWRKSSLAFNADAES